MTLVGRATDVRRPPGDAVPTRPDWMPTQACDTHVHVFPPGLPAASGAAKPLPPPATAADYLARAEALGLERVVFVQPTHYALDNAAQLDATRALGGRARMVAVVDETVEEAALAALAMSGCRGARFFLRPGGAVSADALASVAARIAPLGWHIDLQVDGMELPAREADLAALPCPLVIAHMGRFLEPVAVTDPPFRSLLRLLEAGRTYVKLSAPYVHSAAGAPDYADVAEHARFPPAGVSRSDALGQQLAPSRHAGAADRAPAAGPSPRLGGG